jgi:hypothetical protein
MHYSHPGKTQRTVRCFRCFGGKLSASGISFVAEILGPLSSADAGTARRRLFLAVFHCFFEDAGKAM